MWVYPKHPCTQSFRSHGFAVGRILNENEKNRQEVQR